MRLRKRVSLLACAAAIPILASSALAGPNLSGTWKVNVAKSDFGPMPAPNSQVSTITHEDPKLKIAVKSSSDRGDFEYESNYSTDGTETANEIRGNPSKSVAKWEGDTLVIQTKGSFASTSYTLNDRISLSADGKTLTINRRWASDQGEADQKLILEKQ